jgi:putative addiction module killer protein
MTAIRVVEYLDPVGRSPFARWFDQLSPDAAATVAAALYRLEAGNFSNIKGVGRGVLERRIDHGPGYRIYLAKDGETMIVLLGGSGKHRQDAAIRAAQACWLDYRRRKETGF